MPTFKFNKLIRDKLCEEYEHDGQKATYRKLSKDEHKIKLIEKMIEELREIKITDSRDNISSELADVQQAFNDFAVLCEISEDEIESTRQTKYVKKGGFIGGNFVEKLELSDDDHKWIAYYRERPDVFPEN
jgi:predicted house-cleaning noncanonical NTP pyrophosphatase (MazG superfamily)